MLALVSAQLSFGAAGTNVYRVTTSVVTAPFPGVGTNTPVVTTVAGGSTAVTAATAATTTGAACSGGGEAAAIAAGVLRVGPVYTGQPVVAPCQPVIVQAAAPSWRFQSAEYCPPQAPQVIVQPVVVQSPQPTVFGGLGASVDLSGGVFMSSPVRYPQVWYPNNSWYEHEFYRTPYPKRHLDNSSWVRDFPPTRNINPRGGGYNHDNRGGGGHHRR